MNAPFSAVFRTLNGTAASLSALHETLRRMEAETRTALRLNDQNRERRVCAVQDATDELLEDFAHEYDTLKGDAESLLSAAKIAMNDILDPHFHRMQPQYFSAAMQKPYTPQTCARKHSLHACKKRFPPFKPAQRKSKTRFCCRTPRGSSAPFLRISANRSTCPSSTPTRTCAAARRP